MNIPNTAFTRAAVNMNRLSASYRKIRSVTHQLCNRQLYEHDLLIMAIVLVWKDRFLVNETTVLSCLTS
jgi:hypothetical protein